MAAALFEETANGYLYQTTLNGAINNSTTSVTITDATGWPSTGNFRVQCESEIMKVTARASAVLTVSRGQEGTTAASHADLTAIKIIDTSGARDAWRADSNRLDTAANRPATGKTGGIYQCSDQPYAFLYNSGWKMIRPCFIPNYTPMQVVSGNWTWHNQGGALIDDSSVSGVWYMTCPNSAGDNARYVSEALPSAPYTLETVIWPHSLDEDFLLHFIGVRDSGTSKFVVFNIRGQKLSVDRWTNDTTSTSTLLNKNFYPGKRPVGLQIVDDNTNLIFKVSTNLKDYVTFASEGRTAFLAGADQVILGADVTNGAGLTAACSFLHYRGF